MNIIFNIIIMLVLTASLTCPSPLSAGVVKGKSLKNDGKLHIYNYHLDDYVPLTYREDGKYSQGGLKAVEQAMRSRGDGKTHKIDIGLIELMDHLQDHFEAETIEVISGYRSPAYNKTLRMNGRGAASESLHMQGTAVDLHIDEVSEEALFDYVKKLGLGGAGLYPRYAFVHADVGPRRTWQEESPKKRVMVGTDMNPNPAWNAITDKNVYRPGDEVAIVITNNGYDKLKISKNIWYERFRKGKWSERKNLIKEKRSEKLGIQEATDYSWKIPEDQGLGKYRLVIFTSKDFKIPPVYSNEFYIRTR